MLSVENTKCEFITTNSYTLVHSFLSDIFDRSGPHQILIINPHDATENWELHDDISIKYDICIMNELKSNPYYDFSNTCSKGRYSVLQYSHGNRHNQIFYTNLDSLHTNFIQARLDNPWTHVILVPSDQFTQVQIQFLQRKFQ